MVLASEEEAALEEEVKVEDYWRFFRPCRWINRPFTYLRVSEEGGGSSGGGGLRVEGRMCPRKRSGW